MSCPSDCRYTKEHEWVRVSGASAEIGITDFAQSELGEVVYVDLPELGMAIRQGEALCVIESTKAASDVYAPVGGTVVAVNDTLRDQPEQINHSPYSSGWLVKLEPFAADEVEGLMTAEDYKSFCK